MTLDTRSDDDSSMFDPPTTRPQSIHEMALVEIQADETARIDATMRETSPAAVLAKLERAEADYIAYVSGCQRATLRTTHGKNGVPCPPAVRP